MLSLILSQQKANIDNFIPYYNFYSTQPETWRQNSQELRWQTIGENNNIDAVFGLYRQQLTRDRIYLFLGNIPTNPTVYADIESRHKTLDYAAYANLTWHITPHFDLGGGTSKIGRASCRERV